MQQSRIFGDRPGWTGTRTGVGVHTPRAEAFRLDPPRGFQTVTDDDYMRRALEEAALAASHDDVPVGCVVIDADGAIIGVGENRREIDADPTAHAEIIAIRRAARHRGHWRLDGCSLVVTLEPCAMCAGALVNARVSRLVFGARDPKGGAVVSQFGVGVDARLNHRFTWQGEVLAADAVEQLQLFFRRLRAEGQK